MHSLAVIPSQHLEEEGRRQLGVHGKFFPTVTAGFESLLLIEDISESVMSARTIRSFTLLQDE